jgi:cardiolipin synthase
VAISADLERPLVNLEGFARVIRPGTARVALFDAAQDPTPWRAHAAGRLWWAITLSDQVRAAEVRARAPQLDAVLSASAILRDGHPDDLPPGSAPLRLVRVARQLRAAGVAVELVVGEVQGRGFAALPGPTLAATPPRALGQIVADCWRPPCAADDLGARLEELTGAAPDAAEGVDFVLDNRAARQGLLELIAGAQRSVHLQIYIFENGAVGEAVVRALLAAAERGVAVRVLVDSLYSLHGSLGQENPVLAPLEAHPRVQLRSSRPVAELADLKLRDHRKLIVVDDRLARVSGRNVGATYYTGFDEVALTPETPYRDVPWLDAGVEVTGPVVATIGATFRAAWLRAGGDDFPASAPCGEPRLPVRFVSHEGMADAHTLDAYRALIASARTQITVVNTFPLQFELQRALLRALERGVEVRFLVGNVRPLFGARRPFPGGQLRDLANEIIHGRLDALVDAGARAFEFALQPLPGWAPGLARVLPHVHAKLVSVDGRVCTVGSANLDITAGYWESEALLVIEDPATVRRLDARLEAILRGSEPVDPEDPAWRDRARRRAWLSRNWPSLLG